MAIFKRMTSEVGSSSEGSRKAASGAALVCPHCQKQTRVAVVDGKRVCALCARPLGV